MRRKWWAFRLHAEHTSMLFGRFRRLSLARIVIHTVRSADHIGRQLAAVTWKISVPDVRRALHLCGRYRTRK